MRCPFIGDTSSSHLGRHVAPVALEERAEVPDGTALLHERPFFRKEVLLEPFVLGACTFICRVTLSEDSLGEEITVPFYFSRTVCRKRRDSILFAEILTIRGSLLRTLGFAFHERFHRFLQLSLLLQAGVFMGCF